MARNLLHLERIINCIDIPLVALAVLWLVTTEIVRFPKDCPILCFTFAYCIVSCIIVSRHVELACVPIFFFFFFYLHVMSLHDPFLFDLIFIWIYTWRDLKLIEIQIKPIVTFLRILFFIGYHKNLLYIQNYRIYRISRRVTY